MRRLGIAGLALALASTILTTATLAATLELAPVARHRSADGGAEILQLRCRADGTRTVPTVRGLDRGDVYFVVGARSGDGWHPVLCRTTGQPPAKILVRADGDANAFDVDWSQAAPDPSLEAEWRKAATAHFRHLLNDGRHAPFARFASARLQPATGRQRQDFLRNQRMRRGNVSTFDLTTGAVAIEESLQLQRMRGTGRDRTQTSTVSVASIAGVTVKSHPWEEMLAGRRPKPHAIEKLVPLDQYCFEVASFAKLVELADWMDEYGSPLVAWQGQSSEDAGVKERVERQICLPSSELARTFGPLLIRRIAVTGGDPFLREGADLTILFQVNSRRMFLANLENNRRKAQALRPDARLVNEKHREHAITGLVTPLREISSYHAVIGKFVIVSNSLAGLQRVLDAADGQIPSQDEGLDRLFLRTQLPRGRGEDAFLYLSDDAIRRLVGPQLKLSESRRLECSASLRSIAYATAWRHAQGKKGTTTLAHLREDGDLPKELLYCPHGGEYHLLDDGRSGACSVHGTLEFLTPNVELELELVTKQEKVAYDEFRNSYQRYWSRFFDPIGMQISLGTTKRIETVILPLLDMSEYREMAEFFGGEGTQSGPLTERTSETAVLMTAHINRESQWFGWVEGAVSSLVFPGVKSAALSWVGDRISLFVGDASETVKLRDERDLLESLAEQVFEGQPGGIRIDVRNRLLVAPFIAGLKAWIMNQSGTSLTWESLLERKGVELVRVGPKEPSRSGPEALFYGLIGDGLYLSFHRPTLEAVVDRHAVMRDAKKAAEEEAAAKKEADAKEGTESGETADEEDAAAVVEKSFVDDSHVAVGMWLAGAPRWRGILSKLYEEAGNDLCVRGLEDLDHLESLGLGSPAAQRMFQGAVPRCPLGGTTHRDVSGRLTCSHGAPGEDGARSHSSPLHVLDSVRASLRFTEDGVRTVVEIEERAPVD